MTVELLDRLYQYADEFLIHAVDVEGKASGIERELVELLEESDPGDIRWGNRKFYKIWKNWQSGDSII